MSDTAEKIDGMTDAGAFETLALRVLREIDEDCRAIIHLGINAVGKPIPGPVDGFGRVPDSSPSKYVTAAFTTMNPSGLEQKWLGIRRASGKSSGKGGKKSRNKTSQQDSTSGDLIKAAESASPLRAVDADAHFIVYLCTNRRLDNELMKRVFAFAARSNLEVRFLEQTRLRDFLDTKPEGQWLRLEHLGIAVEQVSLSSLRAASEASLRQYSASMLSPTEQIIVTEQGQRALKALDNHSSSLQLLVGPSGVGKSVIALQIQRSTINTGRCAFWIPGEVVERSISLSDALDSVLRSIHPTLMAGAGARALKMAASGSPLVLVIDDINRLLSPVNVLTKVLRWARPQDATGEKLRPTTPHQIVCPVWGSHWASIHQESESQSWVGVQAVRPFLRKESLEFLCAGLIGNLKVHETELDRFADVLKDDPILLALFIDTMRRNPTGSPSVIAGDVLNSWTGTIIAELSRKTSEPTIEYESAIEKLATEIVIRKTLYPTVADLRSWFTAAGDAVRLLLQLAEAGHLCHLSNRYAVPTFEFRHDRIQEFFVAGALSAMLGNHGPVNPAAWDPFFTLFLGQAIGRRICSDVVLDEALIHNPNALIAALPHLNDGDSNYVASIKQRIRTWLTKRPSASPHAWHYGISLLRETTGAAVLEVTDGLSDGPVLLEARLRNGDVKAGAHVLASRFWPSVNASWMEAIIAQATIRRESEMVSELRSLLCSTNLSDKFRAGALILAGYIGSSQMIGEVRKCWELSKDKKETVLPALWAALRCTDAHPEESIGAIMPVVLDLEDDPTGQTYSRQQSALQDIGWSARHGFTKPALEYLLVLGQTGDYRHVVISILSEIPDATTVPFVIRQIAEWDNNARQAGSISPFAMSWPDRWRYWKAQGRIPDSCIDELKEMWARESEAEWVRKYALTIWNAAAGDLEGLRSISVTDTLYSSAIWFRMLLGDRNVTQDVLSVLPTKPWWLEQIPKIWSDELEPIVRTHLERHLAAPPASIWSNEDFRLAHVLRDIPPAIAEKLLTQHWERLSNRPLFVQVALYLSTERSRTLAASALQHADKDVFKHIDSFFGLMTSGLVDRLSLKHLESLRPHLGLVDDMTISDLIDFCGKHGHLKWAETYLLSEYKHRRDEQAVISSGQKAGIIDRSILRWMPSKNQVFAQLDEIETEEVHLFVRLELLSEAFLERGDSIDKLCDHAREWFNIAPSALRLRLLATVIQYWGRRSDLLFLDSAYKSQQNALISPTFSDVKFTVERRSLS